LIKEEKGESVIIPPRKKPIRKSKKHQIQKVLEKCQQ